MLEGALGIAEKEAGKGPVAVRAIRRPVKSCLGLPEKEALARELELGRPVFGTQDARERQRARLEKRKPRWEGR